jgi:hypothetical protein
MRQAPKPVFGVLRAHIQWRLAASALLTARPAWGCVNADPPRLAARQMKVVAARSARLRMGGGKR